MTSILALASQLATIDSGRNRYSLPVGLFHLGFISSSFWNGLSPHLMETVSPQAVKVPPYPSTLRYTARADLFACAVGVYNQKVQANIYDLVHLTVHPHMLASFMSFYLQSLEIGHRLLTGRLQWSCLACNLMIHKNHLKHLTLSGLEVSDDYFNNRTETLFGAKTMLVSVCLFRVSLGNPDRFFLSTFFSDVRRLEIENTIMSSPLKLPPNLHTLIIKTTKVRLEGTVHRLVIDRGGRDAVWLDECLTILNELTVNYEPRGLNTGQAYEGCLPLSPLTIHLIGISLRGIDLGDNRKHQRLILERCSGVDPDVLELFKEVIMDGASRSSMTVNGRS